MGFFQRIPYEKLEQSETSFEDNMSVQLCQAHYCVQQNTVSTQGSFVHLSHFNELRLRSTSVIGK